MGPKAERETCVRRRHYCGGGPRKRLSWLTPLEVLAVPRFHVPHGESWMHDHEEVEPLRHSVHCLVPQTFVGYPGSLTLIQVSGDECCDLFAASWREWLKITIDPTIPLTIHNRNNCVVVFVDEEQQKARCSCCCCCSCCLLAALLEVQRHASALVSTVLTSLERYRVCHSGSCLIFEF